MPRLADLDLPSDTSLQLCRERARANQQLHAQGLIDGWGRQQLVEIALQGLDSLGGLNASATGFLAGERSFSLLLNTICSTITADLIKRPLAFSAFAPSSDPTRWH